MLDFEVSKVEPCEILVLRHHMPCYVGQFLEVAPRASALHVVAKTLLQVGTACPKALARAAELLTQFDLPKTLRQLCLIAFSGDQQQQGSILRAALAMVIWRSYWMGLPLVLMEPTATCCLK